MPSGASSRSLSSVSKSLPLRLASAQESTIIVIWRPSKDGTMVPGGSSLAMGCLEGPPKL